VSLVKGERQFICNSVAFKTNVCEALSVHQLPCALCEVNDFWLLKHCESSKN
jgi:hypothetical protein